MSRQFIPQDDSGLKARIRKMQEMKAQDPEGYERFIEESRQRSYRLTGRNPDGTRKK